MTVINLRGTGGAGKSTVVRRVLEHYATRTPLMREGRKRPTSYVLQNAAGTPLFVPGHYEIACGGCDTLKTVDEVYEMVRANIDRGHDVLYEGIMVQDDVRRAAELNRELQKRGIRCPCARCEGKGCLYCDGEGTVNEGLYVILLTTPVEDCLKAIYDRREQRTGKVPPLNEKKVRDRAAQVTRSWYRLRDAGALTVQLDREQAYQRCLALLRLGPGPS